MPYKIADLSQYNPIKNWLQAVNDVDGFIHKASQHNWEDPLVRTNVAGANSVDARQTLYHFYQPDSNELDQIPVYLNLYKTLGMKGVAWLDCEDIVYDIKDENGKVIGHINIQPPAPQIYSQWVLNWLLAVQEHTGITPGIYTRAEFWNRAVLHGVDWNWKHFPLWVANYYVLKPTLPVDWTEYKLWQYSSVSKYTWTNYPVDVSWFNGTLAELDTMMPKMVQQPVPVTPPPTSGVPFYVHLNGSVYIMSIHTGPDVSYPVTGKYLINPQCPAMSSSTYKIVEIMPNLWGRIELPFPGWINTSPTYCTKALV